MERSFASGIVKKPVLNQNTNTITIACKDL